MSLRSLQIRYSTEQNKQHQMRLTVKLFFHFLLYFPQLTNAWVSLYSPCNTLHRRNGLNSRQSPKKPSYHTIVSPPLSAVVDSDDNSHYERMLLQAAGDSVTFENFVKEQNNKKNKKNKQLSSLSSHVRSSRTPPDVPRPPAELRRKSMKKTKKSTYQRVEDWEAEQQPQQEPNTWEERVQFDGHRFGNRFKQNEILRKSLNQF